MNTPSGYTARLARKVPADAAKAFHELYAHAGLVLAIASFALSEASKWHAGPAWVAEASGAGLFVIGKFSSARVPATFGDVVRDATAVFPENDVDQVAEKVEQAVPEAEKAADVAAQLDPAAAPIIHEAERTAAAVEQALQQQTGAPASAAPAAAPGVVE